MAIQPQFNELSAKALSHHPLDRNLTFLYSLISRFEIETFKNMTKSSPDTATQFFNSLSTWSRVRLYSAVFCIFGSMGTIYCMAMAKEVPWYGMVTWFVYSGIVAVGWAYSFTLNIKFLFVLLPVSMVVPPLARDLFGYLPGMAPHSPYHGVLALISIGALIGGYILFISFINTEGMRTMRLQTEIGLAQQIHSRLVPPIDLKIARYQFYGRSDSSSEVGGDLLDVVEKDRRIGAFVADVSGHGVRAGVLMAMIKSAARMRLLSDDSLDNLMDDLNRVVMQVKEMDMFVTVACLQFDGSNTARFLLAGHPSILHYHKSTGQITELESNYPPTGVVANLRHVQTDVSFEPGDLFVLLTDGYLEVENKAGEQIGQARIESLIKTNAGRPLNEIFDTVLRAVREHGPQDDDQTLLLVRVS